MKFPGSKTVIKKVTKEEQDTLIKRAIKVLFSKEEKKWKWMHNK